MQRYTWQDIVSISRGLAVRTMTIIRHRMILPPTCAIPQTAGSPHQPVDQGTDYVRENDDQDPDEFIVALVRFFGGAIDQRPQPENKPDQKD
jgi:hypothetical protein